jgi:hypothetical protein
VRAVTKRRIRFFPDWGRKEPLWDTDVNHLAIHISELDITEDLADGLRAVMVFWHRHLDEVHGWDSAENRTWYEEESTRLLAELRHQLGDSAEVIDER